MHLDALRGFNQWVGVRLRPDPDKPGKTHKLPINPRTGAAASSTDPGTWGSYDEAVATGLPVGFVLSSSDPFWCLDVDGRLPHDPTVAPLLAALPGACVEVSQSGQGFHVWGCGTPPAHGCRNTAENFELYHTGRFMCLGRPVSGDAWQDFSAYLPAVVDRWFPPVPGTAVTMGAVDGWTDEPRADWNGITDDDRLIARARESKSTRSVFGGSCSFEALWEADADELARFYPAQSDGSAWGQSEADRALAQHLAFWTGCNCERIERLMWRSKLVRDKWDREDYLRRTILSAVATCRDVFKSPSPPVKPVVTVDGPSVASEYRAEPVFIHPDQFPTVFTGCVYVRSRHAAFVQGLQTLVKPDVFRVMFGSGQYAKGDGKWSDDAWDTFTNSANFRPPQADSTAFRPDLPHGEVFQEQGRYFVNTYLPARVESSPGDVTPFCDHLRRLLPVQLDREILLAYMAAVVQYPGVKFAWAPIIQGIEGNGKSVLSYCVREAVGHKYTSIPSARQLEKEFTGYLDEKIFVMVEDIKASHDLIEILKPIISGTAQDIERKGVDAETKPVCANLMANTNWKEGIPKSRTDRRWCVFYTAQQRPEDMVGVPDAVSALWDWLKSGGFAHVTYYLRTYDIPDALNPATKCQRAPETSSTEEAIAHGAGPVEQEIIEAIHQGAIGFRGDFVSNHYLGELLERKRRPLSTQRRRSVMEALGFIPHPGLREGRAWNPVQPDGVRSLLYVKRGSAAAALTETLAILDAYSRAQAMT